MNSAVGKKEVLLLFEVPLNGTLSGVLKNHKVDLSSSSGDKSTFVFLENAM